MNLHINLGLQNFGVDIHSPGHRFGKTFPWLARWLDERADIIPHQDLTSCKSPWFYVNVLNWITDQIRVYIL